MNDTMFAHSLLFQCEACTGPVAISILGSDRGIESVDAMPLDVTCATCGWVGKLMGVNARRHWVVAWPASASQQIGDGNEVSIRDGIVRHQLSSSIEIKTTGDGKTAGAAED